MGRKKVFFYLVLAEKRTATTLHLVIDAPKKRTLVTEICQQPDVSDAFLPFYVTKRFFEGVWLQNRGG